MKTEIIEHKNDDTGSLPARIPDNQTGGFLPLDVSKYQSQMNSFDMTEEQKRELLEILWSIMAAFVDLGFGVDPVQYIFRDNDRNCLDSEGNEMENNNHSSRFNQIALNSGDRENCP